jgi:hypothetical protein
MPDFDKDLKPVLLNRDQQISQLDNPLTPTPASPYLQSVLARQTGPKTATDAFFGGGPKVTEMAPTVSIAELNANKRYGIYNPETIDIEDQKANAQSNAVKAASGVLKGLNLAATTVAGGFAMLGGTVQSMFTGRLADIWDNEGMRKLDEWNNKVDQEYLPNYYTNQEKNATWYSTDNWFTTNFLFDKLIKNSGFAVGAMVSGNLANAAIKGIGAGIGALAESAAVASEARSGMGLYARFLKNTARAFSVGKNIEAASVLENGLSTITDLDAATSEMANIAKQASKFGKINDVGRRTAIALYSQAGEASFEAMQTSKEYRNNLIQEWKTTHNGEDPNGEDLAIINRNADRVGKMSFFGNIALLSATEYAQLPKILGSSYAAEKQAANSLMGGVKKTVMKEGQLVAAEATTKFGKLYDKVGGVTRYVADWKEGLQENLQYALQVGTQRYYNKAYQGKEAESLVDSMIYGLVGVNDKGEGVGSFNSKEGMEGTLLGAITGGLMQARGTYMENKALNKNTDAFLSSINNAPTFKEAFIDRMKSVNRGVTLQQQQQQAVIQGDKLEAKDLNADIMHNYLATRIKYGRYDMVTEDIKDLREAASTEEGLTSLKEQGIANMNDTIPSYNGRLTTFEKTAAATNELYKSLNLRYSGEKNFTPEVIDKLAYASSKIANYELRIPQVNAALAAAGINTFDVLDTILTQGKPNKQATKEAIAQINNLDTTEDEKDELKTALSDVVEMSLRRKLYITEYNDIRKDPETYQEPAEGSAKFDDKVKVRQALAPEEQVAGKKTTSKELEIGKEYSLSQPIRRDGNKITIAPKITVLSKTLGGEYEVRLPDGQVSFITPQDFKNYDISDVDNTSEGIGAILESAINTVSRRAKYKGLGIDKATNKLEFINALNNPDLMDDIQALFDSKASEFLKEQALERAKRESIQRVSQELEEQQDELDTEAGDTVTEDDTDQSSTWEDMKKLFSRLFTSTITASAVWERERGKDLAPHIVRYNEFINNTKNFKNRANLRIVLVTAEQQSALGLDKLAETSLPEDQRANMNDVNEGFIGAVFVEQDNGNLYPVDKNGKRITDNSGNDVILGKPNAGIDINNVVFSTMPKVDLYYSKPLKNGKANPRYREGQKEQAENQLALWKNYREGLFATKYKAGDAIPSFNFGISRGVPIKTDKTQNNPASVVFGLNVDPKSIANILATNKGLITVSTLGGIAHADGNNYKFAKGRPVLKYDDVLEFLNNGTFSKSQATAIYKVIKMLSDTITSDIASNKKVQLKNKYTQFLQNVLYFSKKGAMSKNKVSIDYANSILTIGDEKFDFANIAKEESRLVEHLQTVFSNVNNATLTKKFNEPFYEFLEDGTERKWANYQSYLLSATTPDGKARTDIPLTVNLTAPTQAVPYTYEQKYAFLTELKFAEAEPKQEAPTATAEGVEYAPEGTFDDKGEKLNRITLNNGEFEFTYTEEGGPKFVKVPEEAVFNYIEKKLNNEKENPNQSARYTPLSEDARVAQALGDFAAVIKSRVEKATQEAPAKVEAAEQAAETAPVPELAPASQELKFEVFGNDVLYTIDGSVAQEYNSPEEAQEGLKKWLASDQPKETSTAKKPAKGRKRNVSANSGEFENFRRVGATEGEKITDEDIKVFKEWAAKNVPGIPYEVLENIIKTHDNKEAWGVFENGVAKFFKGAIKGTEYHEVFEGIFKGFLSESKQRALLDEFKSQKGEFTDRQTGKKIKYSEATDLEAKERIADDFADFKVGKLPARTLGSRIADFFKAIVNFFKGFVAKPSLKEKLFKDINTGKFANRTFPTGKVNDAPEYRLVEGLSAQEVFEFTNDIVAKFMYITTSNNKSLFNINNKSYDGFFTQVIDSYKKNPDNDDIDDDQYKLLVLSAKDKLNSLGFGFDEENIVTINDENANNRLYAADAFTTDFKKSSPYAVKLICASLPKTKGIASEDKLTPPALAYSPNIIGQQLIPYNQVYATLSNKLQNTVSMKRLIEKLHELAVDNPDYVRLFLRLGGSMDTGTIDLSPGALTSDQYRLLTQFMQTYTKVKPTMLVQYVSGNERYVGEPNLANAAKQVEESWTNNMIINADRENSPIIYNPGGREYLLKQGEYKVDSLSDKIEFLNSLGVPFSLATYNKLKTDEDKEAFGDSVQGLRADLVNASKGVITLKRGNAKTIGTRFTTLAGLYAKVEMPNLSNTLYNPEGKMQQTSTDSNAPSLLESLFNSANTLDELKAMMPEIQDVFSSNSQVFKLGGRFFDIEGNRLKENPLQVRVVLGEINSDENEGESMSGLNIGERFTTEINQNIKGNYYVLIPADGSTEWMMNLGNNVAFSQFMSGRGFEDVTQIYRGYLLDDIALAQDSAERSKMLLIGDRASELRFFDEILPGDLLAKVNSLVTSKATPEQVEAFLAEREEQDGETNGEKVDAAVMEFIQNMRTKTISNLTDSKELIANADGTFNYEGLDSAFAEDNNLDKNKLTQDELDMVIDFVNSNYSINNIEYHKILFGDPLQFKTEKGKLDETKRVKSFLSPRRITVDYDELNNWLNDEYNKVYGIQLTEDDYGYHLHKSYARTLTAKDVDIIASLGSMKPAYLQTNEADAASWISPTAYREVKLKNGQWTQEAEDFHQWQMAYARQKLAAKNVYDYGKNTQLMKHDAALMKKPMPKYIIEVLKPIVSGVQGNVGNRMTTVLDKFSQMPIYYQAVENKNLEELFVKMFKEKYDYVVVESGRKVGATKLHPLYKDGKFNTDTFNNTIDVPWKAYGIQVENSYDKPKDQTMGSQLTKVGTIDVYENGKGRVKGAEEAYAKHKDALEKLYRNGYDKLVKELGITDEGDYYSVDNNKVSELLRNEMLRREMSNNAISSVIIDPISGEFIIPFEASTNYVQIRDILYSMVTSRISAPKMSGFSGVQAPVTMWENATEGRRIVRKDDDGKYVEISRKEYDSIPDDEKPTVYLTDDTLEFYTPEKPWCEIYIPFPEESRNLFPGKTDEQIIKLLNDLDPKALSGIGFRIPTQALSSVERFKIKGFLPSFMGATVIVPSAITTKAGSDFDIDKLNMYLRSLYQDGKGNVQSYSLQGDEASTREFYANVYDSLETKPKESKEEYVDNAYRSALENNYYDAIDDILSLPGQFDRLTQANTNKRLMKISEDLNGLRGQNETLIKNRMLDRNYLTNLRHAFLTAKKWVGIGAVNITGHSNTQKVLTVSKNLVLSLKHNSDENGLVSFSGTYDSEDNFISDNLSEYINAFVDVAKDPYILDNIYSNQIVSIFMMLARAGVSPRQAALMMNQPVIREFVKNVDANKEYISSAMFNEDFVNSILSNFETTEAALKASKGKINVANLAKNISDYTTSSLDDEQNAQQRLILGEFFNYVKASNGLFELTQATNYDTTRFRSGDELRKKELKGKNQIKGQRTKYTIGDAQALLDATHIGVLKETLNRADAALGAILKFNTAPFRSLINDIIDPYAANQYLSADKFTRVSNKLTASLLDYIIQTNNDLFVNELTSGDSSIAVKYEEALAKFPDLEILQALEVVPGKTKNAPVTIRLKVNTKDAFDENTYTDLMRGLRDDPDTADLYQSLIRIAIAQGTYRTKVSIKNVIPIEDYADVVSNLVRNAQVDDNVLNFKANNWFQRNNYRDDAVVPKVVPTNYINNNVPVRTSFSGEELYQFSFPSALSYWEAEEGQLAQKAILGINLNSKGADSDVIVVPRLVTGKGGGMVDFQNSKQISRKEYATEAAKDVNKYDELYGYQKVKYKDGTPVIMKRSKTAYPEYVYKLINLYGDGRYVSEYYKNTELASQLENGTVKPKEELADEQIISHLGAMIMYPVDDSEDSEVALINDENVVSSQPSSPNLITIDELKANKEFLGTVVNFVNEIATTKETPVAMRNIEKGKEIRIVEDLMKDKFASKAWTKAAKQADGSYATSLPTDTFNSFDEFLTFALLHEKAHEYIFKDENETIGQYEDRINQEALNKLKGSEAEVRYADKDRRIRIDYPTNIKAETSYEIFKTSKLLEIQKVFNNQDDGTIVDQRNFGNEYEDSYLPQYGMNDAEYKYALQNKEVLNELIKVGEFEFDVQYDTIPDIINRLLKDNETLVDTAQLSLFDENKPEGLPAIDRSPINCK